jgi:hypothetical protein
MVRSGTISPHQGWRHSIDEDGLLEHSDPFKIEGREQSKAAIAADGV